MFQYPGQWPSSPVVSGQYYDVYPAMLFGIPNPVFWLLGLDGLGAITVDISNDDLTLTNQTQPPHIFHNGYVERSYSQSADGAWHVTTYGAGTNDTPDYLGIPVGHLIDQANDKVGPVVFDLMNVEMLIYTTADQLPGYLVEQISNLLP